MPAPTVPPTDRPRRGPGVALAALFAVALLAGGGLWWAGRGDDADRQRAVAARGAEVMPFDLDATTHRFRTTDDGGVQEVVVDDPDEEQEQVALVRAHLHEEADRFAAGDFDDPAAIHGDDMPGLAELRAGADRIDVVVADLPDGARITYTTDDPALVDALHDWFDAQVHDHGDHAEHG